MTHIELCPSSSSSTTHICLPITADDYLFEAEISTSPRRETFHSYQRESSDDDEKEENDDAGNDQQTLSDRPLRLPRSDDHIEEEEDDAELPDHLSNVQNEPKATAPASNEFSQSPPTASNSPSNVPVIVITHGETERKSRSNTPKINCNPPVNMDHLIHQNYFNSSSCPNSPVLSSKTPVTSLSPPGASTIATPHLSFGSKRRGIGHRASYKRAHTGRHSVDHTPNELFIELQELRSDDGNEFYWHECARWIRFEEDFDVEMLRWQAPRVGCLNFHSLLELRRGLQYGIALFDLDEQTLEGIYEAIVNDGIANGQMNKDAKEEVLRLLNSDHRHPEPRSSFRRRSSIIDFQPNAVRRSSLAFRKNEQVSVDGSRRLSLLDPKGNGETNKNLKNLVVKYDHLDESLSTHMHSKGHSTEQISNINSSNDSVNQLRPNSVTSHRPSQIPSKKSRDSMPYRSDVLRRIPENAECAEVLVGNIRHLLRPFMAFVRLSQGQFFNNMTEVPLPVKFMILIIGPVAEENFEIGRCFSTLFSTPDFREIAYQAMDRRDLLNGIHDFLSDSIVLPPGDFDKELLLPVIETAKLKNAQAKRRSMKRIKNKNNASNNHTNSSGAASRHGLGHKSPLSHEKQEEDPFLRSGCIFGGVYREMQRRYVYYKSDFLDGCSLHCLVSLIFMFIACLAPALTFGGIIADKTNNRLGVSEMLIASSINGLIFALVSGQPLLILGPTGPFLVFEEMVFDACQLLETDFWTVRCCVSLWTTFFIIMLVAFEGSFMIRHVTRFTEEIFALIIALVYLYEPFKKLYKIFLSNPVRSKYNYDYPLTCSCNFSSPLNHSFINESWNTESMDSSSSSSSLFSCYDCMSPTVLRLNSTSLIVSDENDLPNKALLSLIILLGTCFISVALKRFRRSKFFGRTSRQTLSDFGMTIALIFMVLFDMFVTKSAGGQSLTQKITVPDSIRPSDRARNDSWFISPSRKFLPVWVYFASSFPAILISVVLFFEVELTSIMIQTKLKCVHANKVIKGTGYHLDILIAGLLVSISGLFGLPWICAAPVRSIAHVASLSKYSNTHAPGEKARLIDINDQRVTNIGVHILIGCTIFAAPIIRKIPVAALFGIFLYFGIVSIPGTQLFSRLKMTFIPTKYHPNVGYLRRVRQMKRNLYTFIQIIAAGLLISIKVTNFAFLFPFILVLLVPFRKWCLPWIFTERELSELDGDEEHRSIFDDEIDFYGQVHLPI